MRLSQEHSLDVRLMLLYGSTVAVGNELAELRRSIGTAAYQVGEELKVCSFLIVVLSRAVFSPTG